MPRFLIARKRLFPTTVLSVLLATAAVEAAGPTGALNDTGQTQCLNAAGTALEACSAANSGDFAPYPRQDGRFGRDPAADKPGISGYGKPAGSGGSGGFAFAPLDVNGNAIALTGNPPVPSETPRCIWDRVTNLIWEVKTDDGGLQDKTWTYGWGANNTGSCYGSQSPAGCGSDNFVTALNAASVCPVAGAGSWRLPSRRELLSIIDHDRATSPAVNTSYFPNTQGWYYWSADVRTPDPTLSWGVVFRNGGTNSFQQTSNYVRARLVRNGPGWNPVQQLFSDNGDGTVTDTVTGLIWDQCTWGQTFNAGAIDGKCAGAGTVGDNWGATFLNWAESLRIWPKITSRDQVFCGRAR